MLRSLPGNNDLLKVVSEMEDSDHSSHLQCGGPCLHRHSTVCSKPSAKDALLTPYTLGNFKLCTRMVYAPLTRCRALGEHVVYTSLLTFRAEWSYVRRVIQRL